MRYWKVFKHLSKTLIHCFHILCRLNKNYILQYNIYMLNFSFSSDNTIFERKLCIEKYWYKISFSLKCITKRYFHDITNMINPPYYYCAKTVIGSCYILHIKYLHYTFLKNENIGNTIPHPSLYHIDYWLLSTFCDIVLVPTFWGWLMISTRHAIHVKLELKMSLDIISQWLFV